MLSADTIHSLFTPPNYLFCDTSAGQFCLLLNDQYTLWFSEYKNKHWLFFSMYVVTSRPNGLLTAWPFCPLLFSKSLNCTLYKQIICGGFNTPVQPISRLFVSARAVAPSGRGPFKLRNRRPRLSVALRGCDVVRWSAEWREGVDNGFWVPKAQIIDSIPHLIRILMDIERSGNQQNTSDISRFLMLNFDTTQKNCHVFEHILFKVNIK